MDRKYYYRILGVREDASINQIQDAYENRMHKLNGDDYADDPEYVRKKIAQAKEAYSVLVGAAAPATKVQLHNRFEKIKDAMESGDDDERKVSREEVRMSERASRRPAAIGKTLSELMGQQFTGEGRASTTSAKTYSSSRRNKSAGIGIIITLIVIISIASSLISACQSFIDDNKYQSYDNDIAQSIDDNSEKLQQADYYARLDESTRDNAAFEVMPPEDPNGDEIWDELYNLTGAMDVYSPSDFVEYITNDEDFYWNNSYYDCAEVIASWIGAPPYDDVAGCTNTLTDEVIADYPGYLRYLTSVAQEVLQ